MKYEAKEQGDSDIGRKLRTAGAVILSAGIGAAQGASIDWNLLDSFFGTKHLDVLYDNNGFGNRYQSLSQFRDSTERVVYRDAFYYNERGVGTSIIDLASDGLVGDPTNPDRDGLVDAVMQTPRGEPRRVMENTGAPQDREFFQDATRRYNEFWSAYQAQERGRMQQQQIRVQRLHRDALR